MNVALFITGDVKVYQCHVYQNKMMLLLTMEKSPMDFYQGVVLLPKLDNSSPSVTRDKEIYLSCDCEVMTSLPSEAEYPMEPFEWGFPAVHI